MKRLAAVAAALVAVAALTGCDANAQEINEDRVKAVEVSTGEGITVICVVYSDYKKGGITCDWEGAQR